MRAPSSTWPGAGRLRFDRYVLDRDRGCLLLDGDEIALRPKTFAVLLHLVENSTRLVPKDELFAAVWPNVAVTDDTLVQSIGELRRALGEGGSRLIRTIPRRGYRLDAAVAPLISANDGDQPSAPSMGMRPSWAAMLAAAVVLTAAVAWNGRGVVRPIEPPAESVGETARPAIAVLPFLSHGNDPARAYFADGMTQDIIDTLGRFPDLTVMSWNAVVPYKGTAAGAAEMARRLAVRYHVEGNVHQTGDRVRASARLVDSRGRVLWSGRIDEALADVFAVQDRMATEIAGALAIRVTQFEQLRASAKPTESLEAYDLVLRARPALQRPTRAGNVEARALLRQAIQLDPEYAAAYAALAETYYIDVSMGWAQSPTAALSRAGEMADKALGLDGAEVRARVVLGRIHIFHHRYEQAKTELDRAIAINPSDARALAGQGNVLMWSGQASAAIDALELAQRIDPELNAIDRFALSLAYYLERRYDAAIEQARLNLRKTDGAHFSRAVLAAAYVQQNRQEDAARAVAELHRADPTFDPRTFGSKLLAPADLDHLRDGLHKAGL